MAVTTHSDLQENLKLSVLVRKRFGESIQINYYPNQTAAKFSLIKEKKIEEDTKGDCQKLSVFHYRGPKVVRPRKISRLVRKEELCHRLHNVYLTNLPKRVVGAYP